MSSIELFAPDGDITILMHEELEETDFFGHLFSEIGTASATTNTVRSFDRALENDSAFTTPNVRLRVSSAHLSHASPVFRAMFAANMSESIALRTAGHLELKLLEDDPVAFRTVMAVLHCTSEKISIRLEFAELVEVCLIVDKYQMYGALALMLGHWTQILHSELESVISKRDPISSIPWLFVLQICKNAEDFQRLSYMITCHATSDFDNVMLSHKVPLSTKLIEAITLARSTLLQRLASVVTSQLLSKLKRFELKPNKDKSYNTSACLNHKREKDREVCRSLTLGSLIALCHDKGLRHVGFGPTFSESVMQLHWYLRNYEYMSGQTLSKTIRCGGNCRQKQEDISCDSCQSAHQMRRCEGVTPEIKTGLSKVIDTFKGLDMLCLEPIYS